MKTRNYLNPSRDRKLLAEQEIELQRQIDVKVPTFSVNIPDCLNDVPAIIEIQNKEKLVGA